MKRFGRMEKKQRTSRRQWAYRDGRGRITGARSIWAKNRGDYDGFPPDGGMRMTKYDPGRNGVY